jgi:hypothetical protein
MSVFLQPIYTQTVGAGNAGSITFNNIPQTFTDLYITVSTRENTVTGPTFVGQWLRFNGDTGSNYSNTRIYGNGSSASSTRDSSQTLAFWGSTPTGSATANTFGNAGIYIPNYTGSNFKSGISDCVAENNATYAEQIPVAFLWRSTAAITSVTLLPQIAFSQYSTFTLYGITKG